MKRKLLVLLALPLSCLLHSCNEPLVLESYVHEVTSRAFGNIDFEVTHEEFLKAGFDYDDMIDITFKDVTDDHQDKTFEVAYVKNYNEAGYYCPCICNYEGKKDRFEMAFGMDPIKNTVGKLENKKVIFKLKKKHGYAKIRQLVDCGRKLSYEEVGRDNRAFANYRDVADIGYIARYIGANRLFRGSSPYNSHSNPDGRHSVVDEFLAANKINTEIALSGSEDEIKEQIKARKIEDPNSKTCELFYNSETETDPANKSFFYADLGTDYFTPSPTGTEPKDGSLTKLVFEYISKRCIKVEESENGETKKTPQPIYIHCNEGKDRTGFFLMVLEALAGVSLQDIVDDFMLTFRNYYNVSRPTDLERYDTIANLSVYRHIYSILVDNPVEDLPKIDWYHFDAKQAVIDKLNKGNKKLYDYARDYLLNTLGLSIEDEKNLAFWFRII